MPTTRVHIDSRAGTSHENNNPHTYDVPLPTALRNIKSVKLVQAYIPHSGLFYVIRSTPLYSSVTTHNTAHVEAVALEGATRTGTHNALIITNDSGTVNLQVHKIVTQESTIVADTTYRSYAVFVCTGTVGSTTTKDLWRLVNMSDTDTSQDVVLRDQLGDTDNDGTYTDEAQGPGIAVVPVPQHPHLSIKVGGSTVSTIQAPLTRAKHERWRSFMFYEQGDIVFETGKTSVPGGNSVRGICASDHLSLNWALDFADKYWVGDSIASSTDESGNTVRTSVPAGAYPTAKSGADGAFHIFQPAILSEGVISETRLMSTADVRIGSADNMRISFETAEGKPYLFPYEGAIAVTNPSVASNAMTVRRSFKYHTLTFEFEHE